MLENKTNTRQSVDLNAVDPFYKAAFTTQISRVRFNQQMEAKRRAAQKRHYPTLLALLGLTLVI